MTQLPYSFFVTTEQVTDFINKSKIGYERVNRNEQLPADLLRALYALNGMDYSSSYYASEWLKEVLQDRFITCNELNWLSEGGNIVEFISNLIINDLCQDVVNDLLRRKLGRKPNVENIIFKFVKP
jgi:hypothetical protein